MISPSQRPLPDNKQHSQQTNIPVPGGIRTHNRSRRAAEDLRLRPRGHWNRLPPPWVLILPSAPCLLTRSPNSPPTLWVRGQLSRRPSLKKRPARSWNVSASQGILSCCCRSNPKARSRGRRVSAGWTTGIFQVRYFGRGKRDIFPLHRLHTGCVAQTNLPSNTRQVCFPPNTAAET